MKEKEVKRIAKSVKRVWLIRNEASEWELRFTVTYQKEVETLTSYYGDAVRGWLKLDAAIKVVEKLFPAITDINVYLSGAKNESQSEKIP